ncbi:hypothetical protein FHS85_003299 [Rhodoligotrophos appendicifer]
MAQSNGKMAANAPVPASLDFYKKVAILRLPQHRDLQLSVRNNYRFAARTVAVPITVSEISHAASTYPVVFADSDKPAPLAVLGVRANENLFVEPDGSWRKGAYVPAFIRRYPFGLVQTPGTSTLSLAIDESSDRLMKEPSGEGASVPLFTEEGKPAPMALSALELCKAMNQDIRRTDQFISDLSTLNLLVAKRADVKLPDNSKLKLDGFRIIAENQLRDMAAEKVVEWHRNGWLGAASLHLASQPNWNRLVEIYLNRISSS